MKGQPFAVAAGHAARREGSIAMAAYLIQDARGFAAGRSICGFEKAGKAIEDFSKFE